MMLIKARGVAGDRGIGSERENILIRFAGAQLRKPALDNVEERVADELIGTHCRRERVPGIEPAPRFQSHEPFQKQAFVFTGG